MTYVKNHSYRDIPFSHETPTEDFSTYVNVANLYAKCESNKDRIIKIRTVGILKSENGCFFIQKIPCTTHHTIHKTSMLLNTQQCILVSLAYFHKSVKNPHMPYPVQIIGKLQWKRVPVIFAQIIQPLKVAVAILLCETFDRVMSTHTCTLPVDCDESDPHST